jgi:hypothetical protein
MEFFDLTISQRKVVAAACSSEGLDESYTSFVARHLDTSDSSWRWCCGSNCDPCVQSLGRAVDRSRRELGIQPPGLSGPDESS